MLEALKTAVSSAVEALRNNGEHRASLAAAITAAHDYIAHLEERVATLEKMVDNGFAVAQSAAAIVDAATGVTPAASGATQAA
ncbi:hypothetical protein WS97_12095 [Burkholderia territorii]|uniref:hypothetical protein n=1 Tax=Burkholderia territorii TaxID=1503055 RepID=UPI0007573BDA|nr:hypothetical protein [Burkholderia territorii]KVL36385.1 hypothetical protein WS97_12095 [Burkholderia territorii]